MKTADHSQAELSVTEGVLWNRSACWVIALTCASVVGCGSDASTGAPAKKVSKGTVAPATDAGPAPQGSTTTGGDAGGVLSDFSTLITGDWTMDPGQEGYVCVRKTIAEDMYVNTFSAIIPKGTHHTLLTMGPPDKPDGVIPCTVAENKTLDVFSSGVGTDTFELPSGIAVKIPKGTQLLLNLHLFNTSADPINGTSGTRGRSMPAADVQQTAEGFLAGTVSINLPPMQKTTTVGGCLMSDDTTLIAVAPHMHVLGTYMKVTAESSIEGDVVIHDAPYDFNEQSFAQIKPLRMAMGDNVKVECTHTNTTDKTVTFGESTHSEMCFAGLYRYPATSDYFICTNGPSEASH